MTVFFLDPAGGTDFPYDASSGARTLAVDSRVTSIGVNSKFGTGSISFDLPTATTSSVITVPDSADWVLTGAFTVESWIYLTSASGGSTNHVIVADGSGTTTSVAWALSLNTAHTALQFQYSTGGTAWTLLSGSKTFNLNTWYHVAVDRDASGVIRLYADGVMLTSVTMATALFDSTLALAVGNYGSSSTVGRFPGWIEELRITNGTARYANDVGYTVPSSEFPTTADSAWANVKLLLRGPGGTTVKGRFKSFSALTTLRCVAGDSVRLPASPTPTLVGNATWANGSRFVTLDSARTLTIENVEALWTGVSANVTQAISGTTRKQGTGCVAFTIAAAFTTGKIAYKTLSSALDLSAYQQISLWFRTNASPVLNSCELHLCSDTTGDVPVHVIPLTENSFNSTNWRAVVKDFAGALSNSIASISLYANVDPGAVAVYVDNIIACKASSSADALTHLSLIGKNTTGEPEWYPLQSIDGTSVELGNYNESTTLTAAATPRPYAGTGETVPLYRLQPIDSVNGQANPSFYTTGRALPVSGADGSPITISGGWDASYTTQTGVTWLTGAHAAGSFIDCSGRSHITISKLGLAHFNNSFGAFLTSSTSTNVRVQFEGVVGCNCVAGSNYNLSHYIDAGNVMCCNQAALASATGDLTFIARRVSGSLIAALQFGGTYGYVTHAYVDLVDNGLTYGYSAQVNTAGKVVLHNTTMTGNVSGDVNFGSGTTVMIDPLLQSTNKVVLSVSAVFDSLRIQNYNRTPDDHRTWTAWGTIVSDATTRHAASGIAWKMSVTSTTLAFSTRPATMPLLRRRLSSGVTTTIKVWMLRDNTGLTCGIKVVGGSIGGIARDTSAAMTAAANTWEQVTLTLTPTEDGTVEVVGWAYGGTTYNCWFDDATVA